MRRLPATSQTLLPLHTYSQYTDRTPTHLSCVLRAAGLGVVESDEPRNKAGAGRSWGASAATSLRADMPPHPPALHCLPSAWFSLPPL